MSLFPHTSETLQQQHPEIYKEFFAKHDLVVKGGYSVRWSPTGLGDQMKIPTMLTNIPLYKWIGINTRDQDIVFDTVISYEKEKESFQNNLFGSYVGYEAKLIDILMLLFKEYEIAGGASISVLTESGRGRGFGFTGNLCALLAYYILSVSPTGGTTQEKVVSLGIRIETMLRGERANGDRIVSTIQKDASTIVYMREYKDNNILVDSQRGYIPLDDSTLPFDWCVLFSGNVADVKKVDNAVTKHHRKRKQRAGEIVSLHDDITQKSWIGYIRTIKQESFFDVLFDSLVITVAEFIVLVKELVTWNDEEHAVSHAVQHLNDMSDIAGLLQGDIEMIAKIHSCFDGTKSEVKEVMGCIPLYSGKYGGSYLVATPYGKSRRGLSKLVVELQKIYSDMVFEFCSWRDGTVHDTISVQQHISDGVFSSYIQKDFLKYINNQGVVEIGRYLDLFEKYKDGFLLDVESNRVYLNGEKLTKAHLKSQTTTVEVLSVLLDHIGEEIPNVSFAPSTFTRQQNQMLGKIIGPLRKLAKEYFKEELPIICTGTLREFGLTLDQTDIVIGKIQKI